MRPDGVEGVGVHSMGSRLARRHEELDFWFPVRKMREPHQREVQPSPEEDEIKLRLADGDGYAFKIVTLKILPNSLNVGRHIQWRGKHRSAILERALARLEQALGQLIRYAADLQFQNAPLLPLD
jgi:hypothetical protein